MRLKGSWLFATIGVMLVNGLISFISALIFFSAGALLYGILASLIFSTILGVISLSILLRGEFIKLDAYKGVIALLVDGTGIAKFKPAKVHDGKIYLSENPIAEFDREKYVLALEKEQTKDAIFALAGKPLIIVDNSVKVPLRKSKLSKLETMILDHVNSVVSLSREMVARSSAIEAVIADKMTKRGVQAFLSKWGFYIFMIIIGIAVAIAIIISVTQTTGAPPQSIVIGR